MKIKFLQLKNFKNFDDRLISFTDEIKISGKNGSGKSSILDAILFALYNCTSDGGKNTDKLIQKGQDSTEVILLLQVDNNKIIRKKTRTKTIVKLNDQETTQENIEAQLNLPSFEVFASIINTGFFMKLDETTQRQIILDLTEDIDRVKLFEKIGGKKSMLDACDLDDLDKSYKTVNSLKLNTKKQIEEKKIQKETYLKELSEIKIEKPNGNQEKLLQEIETIKKEIAEAEEHNRDVEKYKSLSYLTDKRKEISEKIQELEKKESLLTNLTEYDINEVKENILKFKERSGKLYPKIVEIPEANICPICFQTITSNYKKVLEKDNLKNQQEFTSLDNNANQLNDLVGKYNLYQSLKKEFDEINKQVPLTIEQPRELIDTTELYNKKNELQINLNIFQNGLIKNESKIEDKERYENSIKELSGEIEKLEIKYVEAKSLVEILGPKGISFQEIQTKIKPVIEKLKERISGIDIVLLEELKSQIGFKKVFKILVDNTEYKFLSLGEKKKVDIAIAEILNGLLKEKFDNGIDLIFIDNCENLSSEVKTNIPQVFLSRVDKKELEIINL